MKKLLLIIILLSQAVYSNSLGYIENPMEIYTDYISDAGKFIKNHKFDEAVKTYKKAISFVSKNNLPNQLITDANKKIEDTKAKKIKYLQKEEQKKIAKEAKDAKEKAAELEKKNAEKNAIISSKKERIAQLTEQSVQIYSSYAQSLLEKDSLQAARDVYAKIVKIAPKNAEAQVAVLSLDLKLNHEDEVIAFLKSKTIDDAGDLLEYFERSLRQKDEKLADMIQKRILEIDADDPIIKDMMMMWYTKYTTNSRFRELFLNDTARIEANRDYFIFSKITDDSRKSSYEYYTQLVALDLALFKKNGRNTLRQEEQLSQHYNNLGWNALFLKKFDEAIEDFKESSKYLPSSKFPQGNMPHALLFTNQFEEAKRQYLALKDLQFDESSQYATFRDAFLGDFNEFRAAGLGNADMDAIESLLKADLKK